MWLLPSGASRWLAAQEHTSQRLFFGSQRTSEIRGSAEGGRPFAPSPERRASGQCPEVKPLGRVQGGSACWVSRGQSPLGRVQCDNACSGVQRVKPLAQVGLMRASILSGLLSGAKHPDSAASPPLVHSRNSKNK